VLQVVLDGPAPVRAILTDLNGRRLQDVATRADDQGLATIRLERTATTMILRVIGPDIEERRIVPGR
jgi:hypothetical protein